MNKIVAITGASRGLGAEIARQIHRGGGSPLLLARSAEALAKLAAEIGPEALPLACDIADSAAVRTAFHKVAEKHGKLDALICNAAVASPHLIEESSDEEIAAEIGTNLSGAIYCIRAAVPLLRAAGGGDIVTISSVSVHDPFPMLSLYAATKAALETLSNALRAELRASGIRVAVVRVGALQGTSFGLDWTDERRLRAMAIARERNRFENRGAPVPLEIIARAIVDVITLPRNARIDLLDLQPY